VRIGYSRSFPAASRHHRRLDRGTDRWRTPPAGRSEDLGSVDALAHHRGRRTGSLLLTISRWVRQGPAFPVVSARVPVRHRIARNQRRIPSGSVLAIRVEQRLTPRPLSRSKNGGRRARRRTWKGRAKPAYVVGQPEIHELARLQGGSRRRNDDRLDFGSAEAGLRPGRRLVGETRHRHREPEEPEHCRAAPTAIPTAVHCQNFSMRH
jgi:hypothetical protein